MALDEVVIKRSFTWYCKICQHSHTEISRRLKQVTCPYSKVAFKVVEG